MMMMMMCYQYFSKVWRESLSYSGKYAGLQNHSEFKLQLCYNVNFQTNNLGKDKNPLYSTPKYGLIVSLLLFYKDGFDIE